MAAFLEIFLFFEKNYTDNICNENALTSVGWW